MEVEDVPAETDKGPVWKVDSIPQLDGSPEPSENTVEERIDEEEDKSDEDELPNEHNEYVMPSNIWNMRMFMKTSLDLKNIRQTDPIHNCGEIKGEIQAIFEENEINITKVTHNGDCAIVYIQIEKTKRTK